MTQVDSVYENHETVVVTVTTVEKTISLCGTVSVTVTVMATDVDFVGDHVHSVTATVTVYGTVVSTHFGEHELTSYDDGGDKCQLVSTGLTDGE